MKDKIIETFDKYLIIFICVFGTIGLAYTLSHAAGAETLLSKAVFNDYGDQKIVFNTQCSSQAWTLLAASDTIRRALLAQWAPGNAVAGVCISSANSSAVTCDDTTSGVELSSTVISWTDYSHNSWSCRSRGSLLLLGRLKGYMLRDKGDQGNIANPSIQ